MPRSVHQSSFTVHPSPTFALLFALFVWHVGLPSDALASPAKAPPNIVIIFADDVGYGDVGCYGATHVETPNIDRLARQGRLFTDAHSASAVCTPSRYALLTGRYPIRRHNLTNAIFIKSPLIVDTDRTTIADVAKHAGYATACIGKWHLGWGNKTPTDWNAPLQPGPRELGFDTYFGVPVVNSHPPFVLIDNDRVVGWNPDDPFVYGKKAETRTFDEKFHLNAIGGAQKAHAAYDDEKIGTILANKATEWISEQSMKKSPFFLYLATTNIHHPFTPAKRFQGTSSAGPYGDFIHELDWIVGQVMTSLKENGVANNTFVIFTSDNGGMLNRGGQEAYRRGHRLNADLFGFKFDAWEGGHRVPFIARWPGHIEPDSKSNALISNVDLLATVAAVTGQKLGEDDGPDSVILLPVLEGDPTTKVRDELLIAPAEPTHLSLRQGDWMYIGAQGGGGFRAKRVGEHSLGGPAATTFTGQVNSDIADGRIKPDAPAEQLYNLAKDPRQSTNVIRDNPDVAKRMASRLDQILHDPRNDR
ncbi:Arylsulfatase [Planctomycetes bacterium Pan216]|uniref:Arylsulfatase n=1 Tax=Kolteria novifilia TaxID=2527975 RepID=A0A518BCK4_9BACT|nr:Arylsulfatase [Planctomycetes bacterium Pan216]